MNCHVMGIVNVTPDSFSDGGRYFAPEEAVRRARNLVADGADIIDLGGESTRPGALPLSWEEEWARLEPVLKGLGAAASRRVAAGRRSARVSVDTYHPETARRAVAEGATILNCVKGEAVEAMLEILKDDSALELVVPCRLAAADGREPSAAVDMTAVDSRRLSSLGVDAARLYLDPMIGFGTTREEDLALLRAVPALAARGRVLVGASRKRIVKKLTGEKVTGKNLGGNLGLAVWCALAGARVVRVHDVKETVQALRVVAALASH